MQKKMEEVLQKNPQAQAVQMFIRTDRMHKHLFDKFVKQTGMHRSQHGVLMYLYHKPHMPSQKEMAENLEISPVAVTSILSKLEKQGYVSRQTSAEDNRVKEIQITAAGKQIVENTHVFFSNMDLQMFRNFTEEELGQFVHCLSKMQENLRDMEENGVPPKSGTV